MIESRKRWLSGLAIVIVGWIVTAADATGQVGAGWIGRKVVTKYQAPLTVGDKDVAPDPSSRVFTVERAQGHWLRLVAAEGGRGWAQISQVVTLDGALAFYADEIRKGHSPSRACVQRALLWIDKGEYDQAIEDLTGAVRYDPGNAAAYETRALVWMAKQEFGIALADFSDVIQLRPWDFKVYIERGIAWEQAGDPDRAIADFSESIRLEPRNPWAYNNRGNARRSKKDYDRAITDYGSALKVDPDYALAFINRGIAWGREKKEYDRAVSDAGRAIGLDPGNAYAYNDRAIFRENLGDYERARADFEQALLFSPRFQAARAGLAVLLASCPRETLRDGKRAVALATEATQATAPGEPITTSALAAACAETGDFARAVSLQEKAILSTTVPESQAELRSRLDLYKAGKPYRLETPAAPPEDQP